MQAFAPPNARRVTPHEAVALRGALEAAAAQARVFSASTGGAYDDRLAEYDAPGKSWMLVELQHGASGKWRSTSVLPLDVNRTWSATPQTRLVARATAMPPSFDLQVGVYAGKLKFEWSLDQKDVERLLTMRRALIPRDFDDILTVKLKLERVYGRIGLSRDIAAGFASEENFAVLRAQFEHRLGSIPHIRADAVAAATYCALAKAFARCGHSLDQFRMGR